MLYFSPEIMQIYFILVLLKKILRKKHFWIQNDQNGRKMTKKGPFFEKNRFCAEKTILRGPDLRKTPFVGTREIKLHMHLLRKYLITLGQIWI